jgi:hypothetical protein
VGVTKSVTLLRPGPSKVGRLYESGGNIARAVARAQAMIADPKAHPLTVMTNHAAGQADEVLSTVGQLVEVGLNEAGEAVGVIEFADTPSGKACAELATSKAQTGKPFVKGMSIRGNWMSPPRRVQAFGRLLETADDLQILGLDFTHRPSAGGEIGEATGGDGSFLELIEEDDVTTLNEAGDAPGNGKKPYGNVTYADPGYQADEKKRYPLDTAKHVKAAWAYINVKKNADKYSATQLASIKRRIKSAAKKLGIDVVAEAEAFTSEVREVFEAYASMSIDNGPGDIRVAGWISDPGELDALAGRISLAAMAALHALDPDGDGDIDGLDDDDPVDNLCAACDAELPADASFCPECGIAVPDTNESLPATGKEGLVPDDKTKTGTAGDGVAESTTKLAAEDLKAIAAAVLEAQTAATAAAAAAPATGVVTEGAPAVGITEAALEELVVKKVAAGLAEAMPTIAEGLRTALKGDVSRKGLVTESTGTSIDLEADYSAMSPEEKTAYKRELFTAAVLGVTPVTAGAGS